MSLISLDEHGQPSLAATMETPTTDPVSQLTTTQKGSIGEAMAGVQLMLASGGRLTPFRPVADDDGTDLLVLDKATGRVSKVQVKARFAARSLPPATVQFDVRLSTFAAQIDNWLLAILVDPVDGAIWSSWMIPSQTLRNIAMPRGDKLVITPSPTATSRDRYAAWRQQGMADAAVRLMTKAGAGRGGSARRLSAEAPTLPDRKPKWRRTCRINRRRRRSPLVHTTAVCTGRAGNYLGYELFVRSSSRHARRMRGERRARKCAKRKDITYVWPSLAKREGKPSSELGATAPSQWKVKSKGNGTPALTQDGDLGHEPPLENVSPDHLLTDANLSSIRRAFR